MTRRKDPLAQFWGKRFIRKRPVDRITVRSPILADGLKIEETSYKSNSNLPRSEFTSSCGDPCGIFTGAGGLRVPLSREHDTLPSTSPPRRRYFSQNGQPHVFVMTPGQLSTVLSLSPATERLPLISITIVQRTATPAGASVAPAPPPRRTSGTVGRAAVRVTRAGTKLAISSESYASQLRIANV
ncbi:hypothetical protein ALC53_12148 [Atta colombica]|uniref:Uncharacterized protein n=1 Tax=Atta colombica TaxID=520822 RepID=A0A151HZK9_9HYME|nr:hypothetical protein ALC53_12148 [Atta colombica]